MENSTVFKTNTGREIIRSYYNSILGRFPLIQKYIQTSYGNTFILEAGNERNPPIVLLHGSCSNSSAWLGDIAELIKYYHVFAVDILGEPGNSEDNRLSIQSNDYFLWLNEVLNILSIEKAIFMGNSLGGWLVLHYTARYPARVRALLLLASSGIIPPKQTFLEQTAHISSDFNSAKAVNDAVVGDFSMPKEVLEFMMLVLENFIPIAGALPILTKEQLKRLTMPVLYIGGTNDVTMDTTLAARRLSQYVPQTTVILNEGAHVITGVAEIVIPYLADKL